MLREWVVGRGTGTASGHSGVSWKISSRMRWLSQPAVCSKMEQLEWRRRIGDGAYNIADGGTCRRGRVALCSLGVRASFCIFSSALQDRMGWVD